MHQVLITLGILLASTSAHAEWAIRTAKDPMTDEVRAQVSATADDKTKAIAVRCGKSFDMVDGLDIIIGVNEFMGNRSSSRFKVRFDSEEPSRILGYHNTSDTRLFVASEEDEFLAKMKASSRLIVQVTPARKGLVTFTFDLNGFTAAFNEACADILETL